MFFLQMGPDGWHSPFAISSKTLRCYKNKPGFSILTPHLSMWSSHYLHCQSFQKMKTWKSQEGGEEGGKMHELFLKKSKGQWVEERTVLAPCFWPELHRSRPHSSCATFYPCDSGRAFHCTQSVSSTSEKKRYLHSIIVLKIRSNNSEST